MPYRAPTLPRVSVRTVYRDDLVKRLDAFNQTWPNDAAAGRIAVLLHPAVYRAWQRLNPGWVLEAVSDEHYGDGYALAHYRELSGQSVALRWNSARSDYYAHAPGVAWDGIRRETIHLFLLDLQNWVLLGHDTQWSESMSRALNAGLRLVYSTELPEGWSRGDRVLRASGAIQTVLGAEDGVLLVRDESGKRDRLSPAAVNRGSTVRLSGEREQTQANDQPDPLQP